MMKRTSFSFFVLVLEGLVGLHKSVQLQLLWHSVSSSDACRSCPSTVDTLGSAGSAAVMGQTKPSIRLPLGFPRRVVSKITPHAVGVVCTRVHLPQDTSRWDGCRGMGCCWGEHQVHSPVLVIQSHTTRFCLLI